MSNQKENKEIEKLNPAQMLKVVLQNAIDRLEKDEYIFLDFSENVSIFANQNYAELRIDIGNQTAITNGLTVGLEKQVEEINRRKQQQEQE